MKKSKENRQPLRLTISLTRGAADYIVAGDDFPPHVIAGSELAAITEATSSSTWKTDPAAGSELGRQLFNLLNGNSGLLQSALIKARKADRPLELAICTDLNLSILPFELMNDNEFLLLKEYPEVHLYRQVTDKAEFKQPVNRQSTLKILYTACAPLNLPANSLLAYEQEELLMLNALHNPALFLDIDDSGSLQGLYEKLCSSWDPFDVVHITTRYSTFPGTGPVIYMENETGQLDRVSPLRLWRQLKEFPPRLLLLSHDQSNNRAAVRAADAFIFEIITQGFPVVLAWEPGLSTTKTSEFINSLYANLSRGVNLPEAIRQVRLNYKTGYYPWPLLRLFTDGSPAAPLILPTRSDHPGSADHLIYKFLADSQVKVLDQGFIGRRRELQKSVGTLTARGEKQGVLIHGRAGIGKTCLAGKLLEQFKEHELVVIHGEVTALALYWQLLEIFYRRGLTKGLEILSARQEFKQRLNNLFSQVLPEVPLIILLDNFEQNLQQQTGQWELRSAPLPLVRSILCNLAACMHKVKLIITSRQSFQLEYLGKELVESELEEIHLQGFTGGALVRKSAQLPQISASNKQQLYLDTGDGNPRLLEWLDRLATRSAVDNPEELLVTLSGETDEYKHLHLAGLLAATGGAEVLRFTKQAAVYRRPVPASAFSTLGPESCLQTAVDLEIIERNPPGRREVLYWVPAVIRAGKFASLPEAEQLAMHKTASGWYAGIFTTMHLQDPLYLSEGVYHALASGNVPAACKFGIACGKQLTKLQLFLERMHLQQEIADTITEQVITRTVETGNGDVGILLNNLGYVYTVFKDYEKAIKYYKRALIIDLAIFGEEHPTVAIRYNNLGSAYQHAGDSAKAMENYHRALTIDLAVYGHQHAEVAVRYNNLAAACRSAGDYGAAIDNFSRALAIFKTMLGPADPKTKTTAKNLSICRHMQEQQRIGTQDE